MSSSLKVHPDFKVDSEAGVREGGANPKGRVLAADGGGNRSVRTTPGKESPLLAKDDSEEKPAPGGEEAQGAAEEEDEPVVTGMIEKSPESARIILIGSNEAFTDQTLQLVPRRGQ